MPSALSLVRKGIVVKCTAAIFFLMVEWGEGYVNDLTGFE